MENFKSKDPREVIFEEKGALIVDFYASWCGPCKMLAPVLDSVGQRYSNSLKILKVDIDKYPELSNEYKVMSVPTLLFFSDGKLVNREVGFISEEKLCSIIESELMVTV